MAGGRKGVRGPQKDMRFRISHLDKGDESGKLIMKRGKLVMVCLTHQGTKHTEAFVPAVTQRSLDPPKRVSVWSLLFFSPC